ncbi:MAG: HU family DNA-binding protein [Deltaproteobacteria bacterium]|jgi:integration host factor subunit alpha|nr:HU family DNA-binding protein [Deltaproteobacteria bacterium]
MAKPVLTRAELIQLARHTLSLSARDCGALLDSFLQAIKETLDRGEEARLPHLGRFGLRWTPQRPGRNPKTGEPIQIPAKKRVTFSPSPSLRKRLLAQLVESGPEPRSSQGPGDLPRT